MFIFYKKENVHKHKQRKFAYVHCCAISSIDQDNKDRSKLFAQNSLQN